MSLLQDKSASIQQKEGDKLLLSDTAQSEQLTTHFVTVSSLLTTCDSTFAMNSAPFVALAHWKQYRKTGDEQQRAAFLERARWLVEHEISIGNDAGGWPVAVPHPLFSTTGSWLSSLVQGAGLLVLVRAYLLAREEHFLQVAERVVRTFERDILDGGVCAPIGVDGICFEEVAVYPAAHILSGFFCGLSGLHDYVMLTGDHHIEQLAQRGHMTLHRLCDEFDTGYWTRANLLQRDLASMEQYILQVELLKCFATCVPCKECTARADRWKNYSSHPLSRLRVALNNQWTSSRRALLKGVRAMLFPEVPRTDVLRVGIPITAFPLSGGMRTIVASAAYVMRKRWQIEYVTQSVGSHDGEYVIHRFGTSWTHPWQFPAIWLYCLAGGKKLISLLRHEAGYQLLLPQDGVFSSAFTALVGKLAGIRVVAMDHGNLTWLENRVFRAERIQQPIKESWSPPRRILAYLQFKLYWYSLMSLASISARYVDHFLIPGVEGDEETDACNLLRIEPSRVTRYAPMIDLSHYTVLDENEKACKRIQCGIAPDAIIIAQVCRLAPEKGIDVALDALEYLFAALAPERRERVQVIVGGNGPLRQYMEAQVRERGLSQSIAFWGDLPKDKVSELLSLSDISLYSSLRGVGMPLSILEAMASSCAVVATPEPLANVTMLGEGRGIIVPAGNAVQTGMALLRLVNDLDLCQQMGRAARDYVGHYNSPIQFSRALTRITGWSSLDDLLC